MLQILCNYGNTLNGLNKVIYKNRPTFDPFNLLDEFDRSPFLVNLFYFIL